MKPAILTFNVGSSTVKFAVYHLDGDDCRLAAQGTIDSHASTPTVSIVDGAGAPLFEQALADLPDYSDPIRWILQWQRTDGDDRQLLAVGHRVVHGGNRFAAPCLITDAVLAELQALSPLAPLHQPHNLAAIRQVAELAPELPQVACFDTSFHRSMPAVAARFALPRALSDEGVQRYGFHGLSYQYIADVLPRYAPQNCDQRVVVAHLGSGASLCALQQRRSVATTMGFTALDGLPMAERCGDLDPGVVLYLIKEKGMGYDELSHLLYHQSGLLGVSGFSGDMRELERDHSPHARDAIELFVYRTGREIGSLAAALGGLDVLVFTGGIGENSARVRAAIAEHSRWLGVDIDADANQRGAINISSSNSRVGVFVIPTDENQVIATATQQLVASR